LRAELKGVDEWRVAFAFDPKRVAVMLVASGKAGKSARGTTRFIT
jgi:hypothetical protein